MSGIDVDSADIVYYVSDSISFGSVVRKFDSNGNYSLDLMNATSGGGGGNIPTIGGNLIGSTWNMQSWHRDGQNPARFSNMVTFGPVQ